MKDKNIFKSQPNRWSMKRTLAFLGFILAFIITDSIIVIWAIGTLQGKAPIIDWPLFSLAALFAVFSLVCLGFTVRTKWITINPLQEDQNKKSNGNFAPGPSREAGAGGAGTP